MGENWGWTPPECLICVYPASIVVLDENILFKLLTSPALNRAQVVLQ